MEDCRNQKGLGLDLNKVPVSEIQCTICMEPVDEFRGRAILQCGHKFHLDCIGSAFNVKGYMKCPNCRDVEWSDWMYSLTTGDIRTDEDLVNWIANHHPFFVVPNGYHLCAVRGLVGPDNNAVGGQVVYGMANQDYHQEMDRQQALNPNGQTEVTAPTSVTARSSCPVSVDADDINRRIASRSIVTDTITDVYTIRMARNAFEEGSFNPHNRIPIRMFGRDHRESLNFVDVPSQNPSTPDTSFSGHTFSGSISQRAGLFNTMVTEPNPSPNHCTEGTQAPFVFSHGATMLGPAVRSALGCLAPSAGHPSIITATSADVLYLTGVTMHNQETPAPNSPQSSQGYENGHQENENGPQQNENGPQ